MSIISAVVSTAFVVGCMVCAAASQVGPFQSPFTNTAAGFFPGPHPTPPYPAGAFPFSGMAPPYPTPPAPGFRPEVVSPPYPTGESKMPQPTIPYPAATPPPVGFVPEVLPSPPYPTGNPVGMPQPEIPFAAETHSPPNTHMATSTTTTTVPPGLFLSFGNGKLQVYASAQPTQAEAREASARLRSAVGKHRLHEKQLGMPTRLKLLTAAAALLVAWKATHALSDR